MNYFDEHTTNASLRAEIASEVIGDLPGTPATPAPANNATIAASPATLDWADVLNTYGTGSVGTATSYDLYIDNVFKANVTTSQYTVSTSLVAGAIPGR